MKQIHLDTIKTIKITATLLATCLIIFFIWPLIPLVIMLLLIPLIDWHRSHTINKILKEILQDPSTIYLLQRYEYSNHTILHDRTSIETSIYHSPSTSSAISTILEHYYLLQRKQRKLARKLATTPTQTNNNKYTTKHDLIKQTKEDPTTVYLLQRYQRWHGPYIIQDRTYHRRLHPSTSPYEITPKRLLLTYEERKRKANKTTSPIQSTN